jgi:spore cortex formation protein SpoVR/YcgB (stage V sporulation)
MADSYDINLKLPNIQVVDVDFADSRRLTLHHYSINNQILGGEPIEMLLYIKELWGYDVDLFSLDADNEVMECYDTSALL